MAERNTSVKRIDNDLARKIAQIAERNKMDMVRASKEIAKMIEASRGKKLRRHKIVEEIRF